MAPPPPELNEDIIAEILLWLPPDEPAHLVRASLVCKPWRRILSGRAFLRSYRRFHQTPPLLGFFNDMISTSFVPITAAAAFPFSQLAFNSLPWCVLDSHHSHVLLLHRFTYDLLVWDPITGEQEELRNRDPTKLFESAIVLCAAAGCDHCDCHGGPFIVVCVSTDTRDDSVHGCVYSSQDGAWGDFVCVHLDVEVDYFRDHVNSRSGAHVGDAVYFVLTLVAGDRILKYDLGTHCLSTVELPELVSNKNVVLMSAEDGLLGLASTRGTNLYLWSRMVNGEGVAGWVQRRLIDLQMVLPVTIPIDKVKVVGFAEGVNVIFVGTNAGTFTINLKLDSTRKVSGAIYNLVVPFISFYTPGFS
ncbi:unnamed protein product [Urochloa decumbens]|uniref:F-box domain-containing protein n=1 Tax=Urochloa decumbens TaxID=240449 RepID=A0ABC9GT30_9POAL